MLGLQGLANNSRVNSLLKWLMIFLGLIYLVNCCTPLRLHVDTLRYFAIKDCIEFGCPPEADGARDYLPYGYTAFLLGLSKLGLLKSFTIVLVNCIFLFGSLYFIQKILGSTLNVFFFASIVLLNWTSIKFVVHPLSEMPYLFFSMGGLYFYCRFIRERKLQFIGLAFILGFLAFITRTVGIALLGAMVVGLLFAYRTELILFLRRNKIVVVALVGVLIVVGLFSRQLGLNHYLDAFGTEFEEGVGIGDIIKWHFMEWSELFFNAPLSKVVGLVPGGGIEWLYFAGGVFCVAILVRVMFLLWNRMPSIIFIYLCFYSILVFSWPFYDPRFWVPVLPLVLAVVTFAFFELSWKRLPKLMAWPFLVIYSVLGFFSVGYFTYTSLNHKVLARTQANGVYKNEYHTVLFGKPEESDAKVNAAVVSVLKRYSN